MIWVTMSLVGAGRYISFLARLEERNATSVITTKHSYFTFDLINKKILTQNDVFNQTRMWQDPNVRYQFYELLDYTANTHTEDSIDLGYSTQSVCTDRTEYTF